MVQELERDIYRILSGKLLFSYNKKKYVLTFPKPILKYKANLIYESIINDEKYNEWIRLENLDKYMQYMGVWEPGMSAFMKKSEQEIDNLKVSLYNNRLNAKLTNRTKLQLNNLRAKLGQLNGIKQTYYMQTLEGYAESIKNEFIMVNTIYHNGKKAFDKFKSLKNSLNKFTNIVSEIDKHGLSVSDYRRIAKSDLWRSLWNVGKTNIFKNAVSEWTEEQLTIVSYSMMYDSVYEHPEKPTDNVINDDDMLDGWMIIQRRAIEKSKKQDEMLKTNNKLGKAQEVFIFTDSDEGIQEVMSMNSDEAIMDIAHREHVINKYQHIEHTELPDIQKETKNRN
jgi:hypothetical protein